MRARGRAGGREERDGRDKILMDGSMYIYTYIHMYGVRGTRYNAWLCGKGFCWRMRGRCNLIFGELCAFWLGGWLGR